MHALRNAFLFWYAVSFVLAFPLVRHFEDIGVFDSIGIWYSIYCAAGVALPIALILVASAKGIEQGSFWSWLRR